MSSDTSFPHCEPPSDSVPLLTSFTVTSGFRLLFCETSCPLWSTPATWVLVPRCACNLFIYLHLKSQTISYFIQSVSNLLQSLFILTLKLPSLASGIPFKLVRWSFRSPSFCEHFLFSRTKRRAGHLVHFLRQPWNQPFFEGVWLIWEEHGMCHAYRRSGLLTTAGCSQVQFWHTDRGPLRSVAPNRLPSPLAKRVWGHFGSTVGMEYSELFPKKNVTHSEMPLHCRLRQKSLKYFNCSVLFALSKSLIQQS